MIDILTDNTEYCLHSELELSLLVVRIIRGEPTGISTKHT